MKAVPSNRVAALALGLTGLAQIGLSLAGAWPGPVTDRIGLIAGSVLTAAPAIAHIIGQILWDRTPAGQASHTPTPAAGHTFTTYSSTPSPEPVEFSPIPVGDTTRLFDQELIDSEDDYEFSPMPATTEPDYSAVITEPYPQGMPDELAEPAKRAGGPELEQTQ